MLKDMLEAEGITVDLLPATVNANYRADVFVSLHSDSSPDRSRRGYKSAHFKTPRNDWEPLLKRHLDENYFYFTGLPDDDENVSGSMLEYYAFNKKRYKHAVAMQTPAVIVEMGYISNQDDLKIIADPVQPAYALKMGIVTYLQDRGRLPQ
jgi:N-acetylmuramoyl-L-alanine amidase